MTRTWIDAWFDLMAALRSQDWPRCRLLSAELDRLAAYE